MSEYLMILPNCTGVGHALLLDESGHWYHIGANMIGGNEEKGIFIPIKPVQIHPNVALREIKAVTDVEPNDPRELIFPIDGGVLRIIHINPEEYYMSEVRADRCENGDYPLSRLIGPMTLDYVYHYILKPHYKVVELRQE